MKIMSDFKRIVSNTLYPMRTFSEKKPFKDYIVEVDNQHFSIYQPKNEVIAAAHNKVVCTQLPYNKDVLYLYPDIQMIRLRHKIVFNSDNFPGLIKGSHIQLVLLLPYIPKTANRTPKWRLVIITDKCQIYHNFPDDIRNQKSAMLTFSESMVWDLPGNKYPSMNENCEDFEYYFPLLPESAYEYHPAGNSPRIYHVTNKDGREEDLSRFYFPKRSASNNPFVYLDGYEPDPLMTFIGSYCGNATPDDSSRIVVFASHDGGANWFAKYEFNDNGRAENYGNELRPHSDKDAFDPEKVNWSLCKRELIPSEKDAMQMKRGTCIKIKRLQFKETIEAVTENDHNLKSGSIITLQSNGAVSNPDALALLNNGFADDDFGNGVFYKVKVIDEKTVWLYECVSKSRTTLPARHIHSINRVKNGFLVATGENYPQSWLMSFRVTDADNWSNNLACNKIPVVRLNSRRDSVQRVVGAILLDNKEKELIYASDCSSMNLDHTEVIEGIPTNQMGIYKGKLADIDDFRNFELLAEVKEPSFFFKELDGNYVYCGQRGEIAIGFDRGRYWQRGRLDAPLVHYMGRTLNFFVIDGKILRIK